MKGTRVPRASVMGALVPWPQARIAPHRDFAGTAATNTTPSK